MSKEQKSNIFIFYGLLGIAAGIVVLFALDMMAFHGMYVAHHLKQQQPICGAQCHASRSDYHNHTIRRFADFRQTNG